MDRQAGKDLVHRHERNEHALVLRNVFDVPVLLFQACPQQIEQETHDQAADQPQIVDVDDRAEDRYCYGIELHAFFQVGVDPHFQFIENDLVLLAEI